jgi:hypothetical protein
LRGTCRSANEVVGGRTVSNPLGKSLNFKVKSLRTWLIGSAQHHSLGILSNDRQNPPPGGEPRRASQKRSRRAGPLPTRMMPRWRVGDRVRWQHKEGLFHRDLGDGNAEVTIANRAYRVRIGDLRSG